MSRTQNTYMFSPKKDTSARTSNVMYRGRRGDITPQKGVDQNISSGQRLFSHRRAISLHPRIPSSTLLEGHWESGYPGLSWRRLPKQARVEALCNCLHFLSPSPQKKLILHSSVTCFQLAALPLLYLRPTHAERRSPSTYRKPVVNKHP